MPVPVIGFIGLGEAAFLMAQGLQGEGVIEIHAFDVNAHHAELGPTIRERAAQLNISLADSLADLVKNCPIVFCAASAKVAELIAVKAKEYLAADQIYIDLNAASPMVKENIALLVKETGAKFVDAAVMEPVPLRKHQVPIFISGSGAKEFLQFGRDFSMNLTMINETAGSSSAIKMFRSIFMKGYTMLLFETLQASHKYGADQMIMDSLAETFRQKSFEETANMLMTRTAIHAERRVAEMGEVIKTLDMLEVDSSMSKAAKEKLMRLVEIDLRGQLNHQVPEDYREVLNALANLTME
ncbi:DUF1932 domain-containing protein [Neobacillus sp. Marseille-QA0830]